MEGPRLKNNNDDDDNNNNKSKNKLKKTQNQNKQQTNKQLTQHFQAILYAFGNENIYS